METIESIFKFLDQKIEKIDFWLNGDFDFEALSETPLDVSMAFTHKVKRDSDNQKAYIELEVKIFEGAKEKNYPFYLHIVVSGVFGVSASIPDEQFNQYIKVSAVAALFPYLRTTATAITSISGIPPLLLPLLNIAAMFQKERDKKREK